MQRPKQIAQKPDPAALPLKRCLAKTYTSPQGAVTPGRNVFEHACIVGEVAQALIDLYPQALREEFFQAGSARTAGGHDVGKITPTFQKKIIYKATSNIPPELEGIDPGLEKQWGGHAGAGQATLAACNPGKYLAEIVGRHHGRLQGGRLLSTDEVLGGKAWHERRLELLEALKAHFKEPWPQIDSQAKADVLAGLTTVADWIGSGSFFDDPYTPWQDKISRAVLGAGFIKPDILPGLSFETIFGNAPYAVQEQFCNACRKPGVYMLEAPMGLGKTEAALYAAYRLISKKAATGLYFALPTRLTSDKIYERVQVFLQKILAPGSPNRQVFLLHGSAHLRDLEIGEDAAPGGEWFNSLKRAILAPFGVGTLDQALLAVLPDIRHSFVRSFGLLGKVVILDEVHSYDVYTGLLLDSLIERLRKLHCTVIILSATLTRKRRADLLAASAECEDYPLISALALDDSRLLETPASKPADREVIIQACDAEQDAYGEALERSSQGQQVLWIENTVAEAQDSYKQLAARASGNVEHGLLHSRFLPNDRAYLEKRWTGCYGKNSGERDKAGRVLVGTQVLEQSLDIDADFLVTRFCPADMFLQRLGRLWRHGLPNRAPAARCEAWLLVPPQALDLRTEHLGKSAKVYDPYVLFRSLEILRPLTAMRLPGEIRPLMEAAYAEREESGLLAKLKAEMRNKAERLARQARVARSVLGQDRSENIATRYSEIDSSPVLLIRKAEMCKDGLGLHFVDGSEKIFPRNIKAYDKRAWRGLAILLNSNTLSVASYHAPQAALSKDMKEYLKYFVYLGEGEDSALRAALVTESGELRALDGSAASDRYHLEYTAHLGYIADKK